MRKLRSFIFISIITSFLLVGCATPEVASTPSLITTLQGTGDAITDTFLVSGKDGEFEFNVKWSAQGKLFNLFISPYSVDEPSIAGNWDDALQGNMQVSFDSPNPFGTEMGFAIEIIATQNCNWVIEIWQ